MCIQNLSHSNSAGNNSRKFCVSALSSVHIRKSQESKEFISVVRGFCYLITISVRAEKNNNILSRLKTRLCLQRPDQEQNSWLWFLSLCKKFVDASPGAVGTHWVLSDVR